MTRTTALALMALSAVSGVRAQAPAFEVAVIKPTSPDQLMKAIQAKQTPHTGVTIDQARVDMGFQSLADLIVFAYEVAPVQVTGPDYLKTERFDILAKMPAGATEEQVPQMLRALLAERFKLTVHRETKETPIYALIIGKNGIKMKPATTPEMAPEPMEGDRTQNTPFGKMTMRQTANNGMIAFIPGMGVLKGSVGPNGEHIELSNLTTARFAKLLMSEADRVVVDKTGLKGSYLAAFDISMEAPPPPPPPGGAGGGSTPMAAAPRSNPMFQVVEQLGLKLEPQKDSVEMIVVDHIEKTPTEN
jgi:uncharacterized protein (TIGR03435 family)